MKLEVLACDIDQKFPAKTYTITASDGRSISKDLCQEHALPFEEWLEEAGLAPEDAEPEPVQERAPAHKTPARKTVKKTAARRRPRVVTLQEIEEKKNP